MIFKFFIKLLRFLLNFHLSLSLTLVAFIAVGCSSFQGPPDFQGAGLFSFGSGGSQKLIWPVKKPKLSQKFKNNFWSKHSGIDLKGFRGQNIYAVASGRVIYASSGIRGYGKMILIEHGNGLATLYAHLSRYNTKRGRRVKKGQVIGFMGSTGRSTGVHLHFEVLKNKLPIDPMGYY